MKKINLTDEHLKEKYYQYLEEEATQAPEEVRQASKKLDEALEDYIAAVAEFNFANGFRYALKTMQAGGAK